MATGTAVSRLAALGIVLPVPACRQRASLSLFVFPRLMTLLAPVANYVPYVITGSLISDIFIRRVFFGLV